MESVDGVDLVSMMPPRLTILPLDFTAGHQVGHHDQHGQIDWHNDVANFCLTVQIEFGIDTNRQWTLHPIHGRSVENSFADDAAQHQGDAAALTFPVPGGKTDAEPHISPGNIPSVAHFFLERRFDCLKNQRPGHRVANHENEQTDATDEKCEQLFEK
uniref:Uncharacterized protein n=1 Tax=Romanomermis culicivorax TaxID=13658 RepID=A0A915I3Z6_ROMCU